MTTPEELLNTLSPGNRSISLHFDLDHLDLRYKHNSTTGNFWQSKAANDLVRAIMDYLGYEVGRFDKQGQFFHLKKKT